MHPLKKYLRDNSTTEAAFAKKIATSSSYVSQIICSYRWPSRSLADEIERATDGGVTAADLLTWKPDRAS